ncbi:hypothetical protein RB653_007906 [Dictyostelium firmibasis]|uniref:Uncharacterized protein n=1 Tax=Dictyostelium firmibasis TaxID=79012 RepID=A0AAN7TV66_9MYCE
MVKINKPSFLIIFLIIFSIINYKDTLADTTPPTGSPSTTPTQNLTIKYNYEISQLSQDDKYYNATLQGWIDSDGNIFHYSDCINDVEKKCPMASYRDNISRIHYVEYCVPVDYDCCGCNTVGQPINVKGEKNTVLTKVGSCFGCPSDSVCTTRNGAGLRYFCGKTSSASKLLNSITLSTFIIISLLLLLI